MWSNFYAAGGWGMHPVSIFGFLMIAASVLFAIRPQPRLQRLAVTLGFVTFGWGLLGTAAGICLSAHYIQQVEPAKQLVVLSLGVEESLHNVVLALILVIMGGLVTAIGTLRSSNATVAPAS